MKQKDLQIQQLSPELRLLISMELKQKEQDEKLDKFENRMDNICNVLAISSNGWRKSINSLITQIAQKLGGNDFIQTVREESYKLLEERAHVILKTRLSNRRKTMAENGALKSKRDKLNKLDVIGDDPKVLECYLAIVKEMAIKYGVDTNVK